MRRLFIIRKDLNLAPGKLAAMVAHCAEGYWINLLKTYALMGGIMDNEFEYLPVSTESAPDYWRLYRHPILAKAAEEAHERGETSFKFPREDSRPTVTVAMEIPKDVWFEYVEGIFTKTICEAKNLSHLMKVVDVANERGLVEGTDYGFIDDMCLTDLTPEFTDGEGNGRCRVGIWFKPLDDETSHALSKKYQLYKG